MVGVSETSGIFASGLPPPPVSLPEGGVLLVLNLAPAWLERG